MIFEYGNKELHVDLTIFTKEFEHHKEIKEKDLKQIRKKTEEFRKLLNTIKEIDENLMNSDERDENLIRKRQELAFDLYGYSESLAPVIELIRTEEALDILENALKTHKKIRIK